MMNLINCKYVWLLICLCYLVGISTLPLESGTSHHLENDNGKLDKTKTQLNQQGLNINRHRNNTKDDKIFQNASDLKMTATAYQPSRLRLELTTKPRGFNLPKTRPAQHEQNGAVQSAAQNYYNNYFPELPSLGRAPPAYYNFGEEPIIQKILSQRSKQFEPRQQPFPGQDVSILGSGDFGILRGGTFYSGEEQSYINEDGSDFYYGDASNAHTVSSTEGFIQKYTYPEEQFAQFRDFADLGTPVDSDFSQFVVVYAAKNSTKNEQNQKPKNIFDQLQEIDKERALEQKKLRKDQRNPSITKLKLVRTKQMEKKWVQKQPVKPIDDDPLIALS